MIITNSEAGKGEWTSTDVGFVVTGFVLIVHRRGYRFLFPIASH